MTASVGADVGRVTAAGRRGGVGGGAVEDGRRRWPAPADAAQRGPPAGQRRRRTRPSSAAATSTAVGVSPAPSRRAVTAPSHPRSAGAPGPQPRVAAAAAPAAVTPPPAAHQAPLPTVRPPALTPTARSGRPSTAAAATAGGDRAAAAARRRCGRGVARCLSAVGSLLCGRLGGVSPWPPRTSGGGVRGMALGMGADGGHGKGVAGGGDGRRHDDWGARGRLRWGARE